MEPKLPGRKQSIDKVEANERSEAISEAERIEQKIDRDLADSFPASDPPGWTMGVRKRPTKKTQFKEK